MAASTLWTVVNTLLLKTRTIFELELATCFCQQNRVRPTVLWVRHEVSGSHRWPVGGTSSNHGKLKTCHDPFI